MVQEVEHIKPYQPQGSKTEQVRDMFDAIAPAYDFMNRAMTLGIDRWWRRVAVNRVKRHLRNVATPSLLVVATGTGDFALLLHDRLSPVHITGIDLSQGMLDVAMRKVADKGLAGDITFEQGDCLSLPYRDGLFDAVTVAFGVRNFEHLDIGYSQMHRVLRTGGMLCVLELSSSAGSMTSIHCTSSHGWAHSRVATRAPTATCHRASPLCHKARRCCS